jgi:sugar lactone lactonase YvrE
MNEGGCDPDGRFYRGAMAYDKRPGAALPARPGRLVRVVLEGVTISNGLDWSPDGSLAYYHDTATGRVDVFDYDRDAGLSGRRPLVRIPDEVGRPDGLTVDSEGAVWVALNGGGAVHRYTPRGTLDEVVELPVPQVTACTVGDPRLEELFITTSREGLEPGTDPLAGSLFRAVVGVAGRPTAAFAG